MSSLRQGSTYLLFFAIGFFGCRSLALPQTLQASNTAPSTAQRDGRHVFDFNVGTWKTHIMYLQHPLAGSTAWAELDGTVVVHNIWSGDAQMEEFRSDRSGHFETLLLHVYNPESHLWSFIFANSAGGIHCSHMTGGFQNGRGQFFDREPFDGKAILARTTWSDITPKSHRYEVAFSDDEGKTWETNFIAALTREKP